MCHFVWYVTVCDLGAWRRAVCVHVRSASTETAVIQRQLQQPRDECVSWCSAELEPVARGRNELSRMQLAKGCEVPMGKNVR